MRTSRGSARGRRAVLILGAIFTWSASANDVRADEPTERPPDEGSAITRDDPYARPEEEPTKSTAPVPPPPQRPAPPPAAPKHSWRWYGWQTLALDAVGVVLLIDGASGHRPAVLWTGAAVFGLGSPVVHLLHRRPVATLLSLALRGLPLSLITALELFDLGCGPEIGGCAALSLAVAGSVLFPPIVDAASLAWEPGNVKASTMLPPFLPRVSLRREGGAELQIGSPF